MRLLVLHPAFVALAKLRPRNGLLLSVTPAGNEAPAARWSEFRRRALACLFAAAVIASLAPFSTPVSSAEPDYAAARAEMVGVIEHYAREPGSAVAGGRPAPEVLQVMGIVPRHEFVPDRLRGDAYADRPLPIGFGQTISQPFIVAIMTELLRVGKNDIVLEIGTGSGYQAAVLGHLAYRVYTIEIVPGLAEAAADRLRRLGARNVETRVGDGYYGWPEAAPFDGIVVTAAAASIPQPLIRQLKPGGRMVIPVGAPFALQYLTLVEIDAERRVTTRQLLPVAFVPLTGRR
jgi:protein-L-isoaspartate(D-aspartate) O-methyltransferase